MRKLLVLFAALFSAVAFAQFWEATRIGPQQWQLVSQADNQHISWHQSEAEAVERGQEWSIENNFAPYITRHTGTRWVATAEAQLSTKYHIPEWHSTVSDALPVDDQQVLQQSEAYSLDLLDRCTPADDYTGPGVIVITQVSGSLPAALTLSTGVVSGTPSTVENQDVVFGCAQDAGPGNWQSFNFDVQGTDTTAPTVPVIQGVLPTSGSETTSLTFTWAASTDASGIGEYHVWSADNATDCDDEVGASVIGPTTVTSPTVTHILGSLSPSDVRWFKVRAEDTALNVSAYASCAQGTTNSGGGGDPIVAQSWDDSTLALQGGEMALIDSGAGSDCVQTVRTTAAYEGANYLETSLSVTLPNGGTYRCEQRFEPSTSAATDPNQCACEGEDFYYGLAIFLPSGYVDDPSVPNTISQWFHGPSPGGGHWSLQIRDDQWYINGTEYSNNCEGPISSTSGDKNAWTFWMFRWEWADSGAGSCQAWKNPTSELSAKVLDESNVTTYNTGAAGNNWRTGPYLNLWKNNGSFTFTSGTSPRVHGHDAMKVGDTWDDAYTAP